MMGESLLQTLLCNKFQAMRLALLGLLVLNVAVVKPEFEFSLADDHPFAHDEDIDDFGLQHSQGNHKNYEQDDHMGFDYHHDHHHHHHPQNNVDLDFERRIGAIDKMINDSFWKGLNEPLHHHNMPDFSFGGGGGGGGGGGASFGGGFDLQEDYQALFDWGRKMPEVRMVNNFLPNRRELPILHELENACPKRDLYHGSNPQHMAASMKIARMLVSQRSPEDVILMAASLRDKRQVNPMAWLRGVVQATMFRQDMGSLLAPSVVEMMPSMFFNDQIMETAAGGHGGPRECAVVDESVGEDNGEENLLWYWREDVMVNSHHWYWHLSYPPEIQPGMPRRDRRGELFAWMHHTFLARYHTERLAVGLQPLEPLNLERGTIVREGYNPHLTDANSGRRWQPRPPNLPVPGFVTTTNELRNAAPFVIVDNRTIYTQRILESVHRRTLLGRRGEVRIDNSRGIDLLGDVIEASQYSINPEYYGFYGIHNTGHVILSVMVDPVQRQRLPPGVMGDPGTAMRDVVFYPYHVFLDDIFDAHKKTLPPYQLTGGEWPLAWPGVKLIGVSVHAEGHYGAPPPNHLETFWAVRKFDLSRGLDFNRTRLKGPVMACVRHLDHTPFRYEITIESKRPVKATFRIFMAPKYDEYGNAYHIEDQRRLYFPLDRFAVELDSGVNRVVRHSRDSDLTISFPESYRELETELGRPLPRMPDCGCGWPHHLLLPKGTPGKGMPFDLFVMATDGGRDGVGQPHRGGGGGCRTATIYCGVPQGRYPDARPMGYPFDRGIVGGHGYGGEGEETVEDWAAAVPNMAIAKVLITHVDEVRYKRRESPPPPRRPGPPPPRRPHHK